MRPCATVRTHPTRCRRSLLILFGCSILVLGSVTPGLGRVLVVSPNHVLPYPTIQSALNAAAAGDTIRLLEGTFSGAGNRNLQRSDAPDPGIVIASQSGHAVSCVLDLAGNPLGNFFGVWVLFENLTIENGGPLVAMTVQASFVGCRVLQQTGLFEDSNYDCLVTAVDCDFEGLTWTGILSSSCSLLRCSFVNGSAACVWGAGAGQVSATDCLFQGNRTEDTLVSAGTYMLMTDGIELRRCRFLDNTVLQCVTGTSVSADSCIFARNTGSVLHIWAPILGYYPPGSAALRHCTLAANDSAAVILQRPDTLNFQPVIFRADHSIVAFSTGGPAVQCVGRIDALATCCDLFGNSGGDWTGCLAGQNGAGGNISADPLFCGAPPDDPCVLQPESPCVGGSCVLIGARPEGCYASGVAAGSIPDGRTVLQAWPNPTRAGARIAFVKPVSASAPGSSRLRLTVFNSAGRLVRELSGTTPLGIVWDGSDREGRMTPPGVYLLRGESDGTRACGTLVRFR